MNNKEIHVSHVGSASIVLIFTVLSLVSFAVLAFAGSRADNRLSTSLSYRQSAYYEACHKANAFYGAVCSGYDEGALDGTMSTNIPITDNQSLEISIDINNTNSMDNSENTPVITAWQIVNNADYDYDYTLPVIKGND